MIGSRQESRSSLGGQGVVVLLFIYLFAVFCRTILGAFACVCMCTCECGRGRGNESQASWTLIRFKWHWGFGWPWGLPGDHVT